MQSLVSNETGQRQQDQSYGNQSQHDSWNGQPQGLEMLFRHSTQSSVAGFLTGGIQSIVPYPHHRRPFLGCQAYSGPNGFPYPHHRRLVLSCQSRLFLSLGLKDEGLDHLVENPVACRVQVFFPQALRSVDFILQNLRCLAAQPIDHAGIKVITSSQQDISFPFQELYKAIRLNLLRLGIQLRGLYRTVLLQSGLNILD